MKNKITGLLLVALIVASAFALFACGKAEKITIAANNTTEYTIAYAKAEGDSPSHYDYAVRLFRHINIMLEVPDIERYVYTDRSSEHEILLGATDRPLSQQLVAEVNAANLSGNDIVWGYGYKDGKLAFYANNSIIKKSYVSAYFFHIRKNMRRKKNCGLLSYR